LELQKLNLVVTLVKNGALEQLNTATDRAFLGIVYQKSFLLLIENDCSKNIKDLAKGSLAAGLVAYLKRDDIRRWLYRSRFEPAGEPFEIDEEKVEAMVIPVSRREQPEWLLRWLNPKKVALICTERTKDTSREIEEKFGNKVVFYPAKVTKDPDDPDETRQEIKHCLSRFKAEGIHPTHIFVDTTGGKVPMSIGAFLAAEEEGVSSIYLVGKVERNGVMIVDDPENREHGRPIFISNHTQA